MANILLEKVFQAKKITFQEILLIFIQYLTHFDDNFVIISLLSYKVLYSSNVAIKIHLKS